MDGRAARAERTRNAVVDALLDLIEEGDLQPTAQAVAERAGVSLRIVYVHFDDHAALFAAAAARHTARIVEDIKPVPATGTLDARLDAFVQLRARVYQRIFNVRRAARLIEHQAPLVAQTLKFVRALKREEAERVFERELIALSGALRGDRAAALGAITSFNTWESLRAHQQLSVEDSKRIWRGMIKAVLQEE